MIPRMHVVIFEGSKWPSFAPLSLSRPVFSLMAGMSTLLDKQIRMLKPNRLTLWVRPGLAEWCRTHVAPTLGVPTAINQPLDDEPALLTSGRSLWLSEHEDDLREPHVVMEDDDIVRKAYVKSPGLSPDDVMLRSDAWMKILDLPRATQQGRLAQHVWDLISWNEEALVADAIHLRDASRPHPAGPYHLIGEDDVHLAKDVKLSPGCVLDASKGPVVIDVGATIGANAVLQGPCFIGKYVNVSPLSLIRAGTSVGPSSKVGGEISNSIILGNSNKVHEGFLGDSYLGEWVNLGAGTTTSNLKNTYGQIKMRIGPRVIQTDRRFLGAMIGDHTKLSIGTRLMSGSYVGCYSLVATSHFPPQFVPSFTFMTDGGTEKYRQEKAKEVITQVFGRRGRQWTATDEHLLKYAAETAELVEKV